MGKRLIRFERKDSLQKSLQATGRGEAAKALLPAEDEDRSASLLTEATSE